MKWGGGGMLGAGGTGGAGTTGGSPAAGGGGRGGRGVFRADPILVSNMLDLLLTGGGGAAGSTGRGRHRNQKPQTCDSKLKSDFRKQNVSQKIRI